MSAMSHGCYLELEGIPGISAISLGEILRYRKQHLSGA